MIGSRLSDIIVKTTIPDNLFADIKDKVASIAKTKENHFGHELAGNVFEAFKLDINFPALNHFIIKNIKDNPWFMSYVRSKQKSFLKTDCNEQYKLELKLVNCWVNFMKKHEFNPIHNHGGLVSFILFIQIPFNYKELQNISPGRASNSKRAGAVEFYGVDWERIIDTLYFEVDKTYEKKAFIFPAALQHSVYPFYGTDEYRITVSGNLAFTKVTKGDL